MIKNVVSFDFDGTLLFTPEPETGKKIWLSKTGNVYPYPGWWGKKESLDLNIFYIPVNPFVHKKYLEARSNPHTHTFLATGRIVKLRNEVDKILNSHDLTFDDVVLNPGMSTLNFKIKLFEQKIAKYKPDVFTMYDDRHDHIVEFEKWARFQKCRIEIIDVTKADKTPKIIN